MLAAVDAGVPVVEYTPAAVKVAVVGYGRADKTQMQQMVKMLLGLGAAPKPHDAADALALAICHLHTATSLVAQAKTIDRTRGGKASVEKRGLRSWRDYRPAT